MIRNRHRAINQYPATKVLYLVGVQNAINLAKSFGLATLATRTNTASL